MKTRQSSPQKKARTRAAAGSWLFCLPTNIDKYRRVPVTCRSLTNIDKSRRVAGTLDTTHPKNLQVLTKKC